MPAPTQQQAKGFLESQLAYIEPQVYMEKYPDIRFRRLMPIDTAPDAWTPTVTRYTSNVTGQADWFAPGAGDVPRADVTKAKIDFPVYAAAAGYEYTIDEVQTTMMLGRSLGAEKAMAARLHSEKFLDELALNGNSDRSIDGFWNAGEVSSVQAVNGAGGERTWASKTPQEIRKDVNDAIAHIYTATQQIYIPDTVCLPINQYLHIATTYIGDDQRQTVLRSLMEANVYTAETGNPLTIRSVRGLGSVSSATRMVVYKRHPDVLRFCIPMPFRFLPVFQASSMVWKVDGLMRVGGLDVRLPAAMRYITGI